MKCKTLIVGFLIIPIITACIGGTAELETKTADIVSAGNTAEDYPKIASWLAKKDEIIASDKPYDLVMSGWFVPEEADQIRANNPDALLLGGLSANWIWANEDWLYFLETIASYGREPLTISEDMYLRNPDGSRCAFGWASEKWDQEEIYAMDPRSEEWIELITAFYKNVLDQPQHDGIIVDMVVEENFWCPQAISAQEWLQATTAIYEQISDLNTENKLVIFNAGACYADIDVYAQYFDGFLLENFMGNLIKTTYQDGLDAAATGKIVILNPDTDDTGQQNMELMRLSLTLSLLFDNTYFTYDFGPRDHGQAWWYPEYDVQLGKSLGDHYHKDNAYWRDFEHGTVVSAPNADVMVEFIQEHTDVTTGIRATFFTVEKGDGRIFLK